MTPRSCREGCPRHARTAVTTTSESRLLAGGCRAAGVPRRYPGRVAADVSRTDVLVATTCAVAGGILTVLRASAPPGWAPAWLELVAQLAAAAALLARRRAPLLVLAACAALSFVAPVVAAL